MENKPTCEVDENRSQRWYLNGQYHREDGPAIEHLNGCKAWYLYGKCHRLDGPAVIWFDGHVNWYVNDIPITVKITKWAENNDIDLDNLSEVDKALIKLVWSDYGR